ncbi:glycosyltransferase family 2 protein [Mobilicoccus massiliensis]|uniref:glycosyltransferase family 2 protein n=1 Tax=Mobilicoccus massiliensis TaxID=1522310 RepID=UPI0005900035|nr:glycosyltransferase [Mobilicoccus massiliensis]
MPGPRTTVVIATRNRRDEVLRHLPRHDRPVVLVDNASTDGTAEAVEREFPDVRVVRLPTNSGARARTVGSVAATTPYVAFADDDSWWAPGSLDLAEHLFDTHPRLGLIAAGITVEPGGTPDPINTVLAESPLPAKGDAPGPEVLGFVGCAAVVRRDAFHAAGGFDDVIRFPGEEQRLALDLDDASWQLAHVPEVVAHHEPSSSRESDETRRRGLVRSHLLTSLMRLPWRDVVTDLRRALATSRGRRALLEAAPRIPRALARRRVVGAATLRRLELLESEASAGSEAGR